MKPLEYDLKIIRTIRALRELKEVKQSEMAEVLNMDPSNYCRIEKGEISITPGQLKLISDKIKISVTLILAIANADENINFKITSLDNILMKFVMMFEGAHERFGLDEKEMELIVRKIKEAYKKEKEKEREKEREKEKMNEK